MKKKSKPTTLLFVEILEAKENPMFTEQQRATIRFLRFNQPVACAACGKKKRILWTMLCQFKAADMTANHFAMQLYPQSFTPLTPVCDHPLRPDWPEEKKV